MFNNFFKAFWTILVVNVLIGLGVLGFVVWVIVKLMQHFNVI